MDGTDRRRPSLVSAVFDGTDGLTICLAGGMHNNGGGARTVRVIEGNLPPVLTISDTSDITIPVNGTWSAPSAICTDKEDGDLTDEIEVRHTNSVDTTKPGTYYCVDSANQHAQDSIKIIVKEGS